MDAGSIPAASTKNFLLFTFMATQEETRKAIEDCLKRIGQEAKINFKEFVVDDYTQGKYRSGSWTYKISGGNRVSIDYWFDPFSSRKEETDISYAADGDAKKLESDLKECQASVRRFVNKKKGIF